NILVRRRQILVSSQRHGAAVLPDTTTGARLATGGAFQGNVGAILGYARRGITIDRAGYVVTSRKAWIGSEGRHADGSRDGCKLSHVSSSVLDEKERKQKTIGSGGMHTLRTGEDKARLKFHGSTGTAVAAFTTPVGNLVCREQDIDTACNGRS